MKKNKYGEELVNVSAYVRRDLRDNLVRFAKEDGFSTMSDFVRKVLREYTDKRNAAQTSEE